MPKIASFSALPKNTRRQRKQHTQARPGSKRQRHRPCNARYIEIGAVERPEKRRQTNDNDRPSLHPSGPFKPQRHQNIAPPWWSPDPSYTLQPMNGDDLECTAAYTGERGRGERCTKKRNTLIQGLSLHPDHSDCCCCGSTHT